VKKNKTFGFPKLLAETEVISVSAVDRRPQSSRALRLGAERERDAGSREGLASVEGACRQGHSTPQGAHSGRKEGEPKPQRVGSPPHSHVAEDAGVEAGSMRR